MIHDILVFDFDGTIADSSVAIFEIAGRLSDRYKFRHIRGMKDIERLRKLGTEEIIKELKIPEESIPGVMDGIEKGLTERSAEFIPVAGIPEVLRGLAERSYRMVILSTNTEDNVRKFLKKFDIEYFDRIYPESGLYGKGKLLKKLMNDQDAKEEEVIYIGDETRDVKAGKECGIKTAAVTWGINGREALQSKKPDWLVERPGQLLEIFQ